MSNGLIGKFASFFRNVFPERQIFLRTNGEVSYLSLGLGVQLFLSLTVVAFFAWVAFASLNLIFKDQIIESKDQNLAKMHAHIRDLNLEMDRLQDRFVSQTEGLEINHQSLSDLVSWQNTITDRLENIRSAMGPDYSGGSAVQHKSGIKAPIPGSKPEDMIGTGGPETVENDATDSLKKKDSELEQDQGLLNKGAFLVHRFFTETLNIERVDASAKFARAVNRLEGRLVALKYSQNDLLEYLESSTRNHTIELENIINLTGLQVINVMERVEPTTVAHVGGPYIPLDESIKEVEADGSLKKSERLSRLVRDMGRMSHLQDAVSSLPLVTPVENYRFTDRFGPRRDPFSKKVAFHSGLDLASKPKTPVMSPLDGIVVFAGYNGAYGRMVEIDHGNGFTTRYGHLRKILVKKGDKISFRQQIGLMGSSGRSTGTHLHYEVWFDGKVRDPQPFLNAGRYVFEG